MSDTIKLKIKERYSYGWTDPRVFNMSHPISFKRYGEEYKMESKKVNIEELEEAHEREYAESLASSIYKIIESSLDKIFAYEYNKFAKRYTKEDDRGKKMKADGHEYTTEAEHLPIDVCENMWLVAYGNEPVAASSLINQEEVLWEIGNRLFWADKLVHSKDEDTYALCK